MASTYLTRTPSGAGNQKTYTFSCWVKRSAISTGVINGLFVGQNTSATEITGFRFSTSDTIEFGTFSGSWDWQLVTNRVFRDTNAWYHIVFAVDTTQATSSNRAKLYINGVQETSFSTETYPSLNFDTDVNTTNLHVVGAAIFTNVIEHLDGSMAHVHFTDGTAYDADTFGETDATTGIWKPKTAPSVTYGTNGFFLKFENSGAFGTDSSGNGNTFTVNGTMTQTLDTPSNVFATLNPLNVPTSNAPTFSQGNLVSSTSDSGQFGGTSTLGVSSGKWYAEFKSAETGGEEKEMVGVTHAPANDARSNLNVGRSAESFAIRFLDGQQSNNNSASDYGSAFSVGDICQVALDVDNNQLYFGKNGQWGDGSGNFNQSTPTSAITITTIANSTEGAYFFSVGDLSSSSGRSLISCNFGSPPFAISSGNADGEGFGNFEYAVPSGYFALCSKNLSEYGG